MNIGTGCRNLGLSYSEGTGVKQDFSQANQYFQKACDLKEGKGCFIIGHHYQNGKLVRQNKNTAKEYYGKACDYGYQDGCDAYRKLNEQGY